MSLLKAALRQFSGLVRAVKAEKIRLSRNVDFAEPRAIAFVNNYISYSLLAAELEAKGISTKETVLISGREVQPSSDFLHFHTYPGMPEDSLTKNLRFVPYYLSAAAIVRKSLASERLEEIFVVNQDNIISNHLLNNSKDANTNVLCEGLLNFNQVEEAQHGAWRDRVRPILAFLVGLRYKAPMGHLSGSQRADVSSVITFQNEGIVAPPEKTVVRNFLTTSGAAHPAEKNAALIIGTSLYRLMPNVEYQKFADRYVDWILSQGFSSIYYKRHPRSVDLYLESLLTDAYLYGEGLPVEELASQLPAKNVIGPGTTPLVTLKLLRPELRCVDVGSDIYSKALYDSDQGMIRLFTRVGIECVHLGDTFDELGESE